MDGHSRLGANWELGLALWLGGGCPLVNISCSDVFISP